MRTELSFFFLRLCFKVFQAKSPEPTVWNHDHLSPIYTLGLRRFCTCLRFVADAHRNYLLGLYFGAEEKEKGQFWEEDANTVK